MSRIGKLPVEVPAGVEVTIGEGNLVTVKGPKGTLTRKMAEDMNIAVEAGQIVVTRPSDLKRHKALHGLTRTLIFNMIVGVTQGYEKVLEINGVGYRAAKSGKKLTLTLGYLGVRETFLLYFKMIFKNLSGFFLNKGIMRSETGKIQTDFQC